ncbi:copper homeostasis protein CutC [Clostridium tarantellae]|uniref:Copper homeostasis protein cutC homolog n=1 Tax=Clostridium tarantellae TaxID=39493 RepID=A0A6I1MHR3_9CLOT|nr:copper homeostasis protein CutC [Clostridium tarantellae]MPQ42945.1 copper homeostasis protein CutC [Clostridium tarantellae]
MIEICCGSYEDAINSYLGGAKRIELNSALYLGGLTPSIASLTLTKKNTDLSVICMVRPRGAGFCYNNIEFEQIMEDAKVLLENGADGLAFGFLNEDHTIDIKKTMEMVNLIKKYKGEAVFHRAFDCVKDPIKSIELLINMKIHRLLTSGLQAKAMDGKDMIKILQENYGDRIEILAGSGVNASNVNELMEYTKISQVHSSCKDWCTDVTTSGEGVNYCYGPEGHKNDYDFVSKELVKKLVEISK